MRALLSFVQAVLLVPTQSGSGLGLPRRHANRAGTGQERQRAEAGERGVKESRGAALTPLAVPMSFGGLFHRRAPMKHAPRLFKIGSWPLSHVFRSHPYLEVGYRTLSRPPISVWEQQAAVTRLRELGRADVDENALFTMVEQMRHITETAAATTRKALRDASAARPGARSAASACARHRQRGSQAVRGDRAVVTGDGPLDLSHLHEAAQLIARLPAEERLRYVRADRWIGDTRATAALEQMETLLAWPAKQRMPNLLLIGPTNNGKSMIVEKFRRAHPPASHPGREEIPVLVVQMPSEPSVGRFYTALLAATGAPMRSRYQLADLEQLVLRLLRAASVRMLVIDELHNVPTSSASGPARAWPSPARTAGSAAGSPGSRPPRTARSAACTTAATTTSPRSPPCSASAGQPSTGPWSAPPRFPRSPSAPGPHRHRQGRPAAHPPP
jgi:hypothetical protein